MTVQEALQFPQTESVKKYHEFTVRENSGCEERFRFLRQNIDRQIKLTKNIDDR